MRIHTAYFYLAYKLARLGGYDIACELPADRIIIERNNVSPGHFRRRSAGADIVEVFYSDPDPEYTLVTAHSLVCHCATGYSVLLRIYGIFLALVRGKIAVGRTVYRLLNIVFVFYVCRHDPQGITKDRRVAGIYC